LGLSNKIQPGELFILVPQKYQNIIDEGENNMSGKALRAKIFEAKDIKTEIMNIPEWGVVIEVKALTGKTRAIVMTSSMGKNGKMDFEKMYADMVIYSTYDNETKEKIFEDTDREALSEKSGGVLERIAGKVMQLSGLMPESVDKAEKN
jgi:hypothetical protein